MPVSTDPITVRRQKGQIWSHVRKKWLLETPEEAVRQEYPCILVNDYGFSLAQIDEEVTLPGKRGNKNARADFVIWRTVEERRAGKIALIVVECKADNVAIDQDAYQQGANYANNEHLDPAAAFDEIAKILFIKVWVERRLKEKRMLDPQEGECICDPASGSGGFLIRCFEIIREAIAADVDAQYRAFCEAIDKKRGVSLAAKAKAKTAEYRKLQQQIDPYSDPDKFVSDRTRSRIYKLSNFCIYGTDANDRMARTSKMNMIMHGDGHGGVHHHNGLLNVNGIFEGRFQVIATNPPFGASVTSENVILPGDYQVSPEAHSRYAGEYGEAYREAVDRIRAAEGKPILSLFQLPWRGRQAPTPKTAPDNAGNSKKERSVSMKTELVFIERCLDLLAPGGRMGIVLPEGIFNNPSLSYVREFTEDRAFLRAVVSLSQDTFVSSGAYVKLLFRMDSFRERINSLISGASGRKRVEPSTLESIEVPLPPLATQRAIVAHWQATQNKNAAAFKAADEHEVSSRQKFLKALGLSAGKAGPVPRAFAARWSDVDAWNCKSIHLGLSQGDMRKGAFPVVKGRDCLDSVQHGCSQGPSTDPTTLEVLKISAATRGEYDRNQRKFIADNPQIRCRFDLRSGDVLMCRTNGTLDYVGMSALVREDEPDLIFPDKLIRARVSETMMPEFLWLVLQTPPLRGQIETAARTAVGNYAIGGADIWNFEFPLPPLTIQRQLVAEVTAAREHIAAARAAAAKRAGDTAREVEQMILGQIPVPKSKS